MAWTVHLAGLSPAPWRHCNAVIDRSSLLMTVTRVPLYRVIWQLSLPRAVVSCMTFCVSGRYIIYLYLYYVRWTSPASLKCYLRLIFIVHFLFEWVYEITILPSTCAIVLRRARLDSATSRAAPASFAHIHRSLLFLTLFPFCFVTFVLYSFLSVLCDRNPLSYVFPQTPLF